MSDDVFPLGADVEGIGARMLRLRTQQGATQAYLAGDVFTRAYVSSIEGGKRTPSPRASSYFAERLGVAMEDLCYPYEPGRRRALRTAAADARLALSRGEVAQASAVYQEVVSAAGVHRDPELSATGFCGLGLIARHQGNPDRALEMFTAAEELLDQQPLNVRLPAVMGRMGALFARGAIFEALALAEDELRAAPQNGETAAKFALRAATVLPRVERGDVEQAQAAADAALEMAPQVKDPEVLAQGYYHVNRVLTAQARYEEAEQVLTRAVALYEHLRLRTEVGMCHFAQGYLSARKGDLARAEGRLRHAADVFAETHALPRQVNATAELADVLRTMGRTAEAGALVEECKTLALGYLDPEQAAELDRIGAHIAVDRGDEVGAEALFRSAIDRYQDVGAMLEMATTCRLLGDRLIIRGRTEEAAAVFRRGLMSLEKA
ncbi:tetratricopeptide repeat protein [Streptomyces sp. NPDC003038]|uniref:tetratricopeptide repeat protein n=1 Tax=unclassified Streptomyces TaxID=2593676 RepID=UPI0033AAE640